MDNKEFKRLPQSELTVMQGIWELTERGEEDIQASSLIHVFPDTIGRFKLTTVLTLATRLHQKGFISVEKHGRSNCYQPLVAEEDYRRDAAADFVATVYRSKPAELFSALCDSGILTDKDIEELKSMLE